MAFSTGVWVAIITTLALASILSIVLYYIFLQASKSLDRKSNLYKERIAACIVSLVTCLAFGVFIIILLAVKASDRIDFVKTVKLNPEVAVLVDSDASYHTITYLSKDNKLCDADTSSVEGYWIITQKTIKCKTIPDFLVKEIRNGN